MEEQIMMQLMEMTRQLTKIAETEQKIYSFLTTNQPKPKTPEQWKTDISAVLGTEKVKDRIDEEAKEQLEEKSGEIAELSGRIKTVTQFSDGLNYDEYLLIMIASLKDSVRILRIMDLIQINMKYRYYADFNMMEYYTGIRFTIEANGKSHEFEDAYK